MKPQITVSQRYYLGAQTAEETADELVRELDKKYRTNFGKPTIHWRKRTLRNLFFGEPVSDHKAYGIMIRTTLSGNNDTYVRVDPEKLPALAEDIKREKISNIQEFLGFLKK